MPRRLRGNEPTDNPFSAHAPASASVSAPGSRTTSPDALLTFRVLQEPLLLANVANTLRAVTRLHTKLWLIGHNYASDVVAYATTLDTAYADKVQLPVASMTQNSPLTVVVMVSEALGKALASLIDAVSQTPQRYQWMKQQVEHDIKQNQAELNALTMQSQIQAQQARLDARERALALQQRQVALQQEMVRLKARELELRESQVYMQMNIRTVALEQALLEVERLNPGASIEARQMMAQALMEELLQLSSSTGLVMESVRPRESA